MLNVILPYSAFKETGAPIAFALQSIGIKWASTVVSVGAICGITSILLVGLFGQTRVFFAIARWAVAWIFAKIHGKYNTSVNGIAAIGSIGTAIAAFVPITDVVQLVNIGTLAAFIIVSFV